MKSWVYNAEYTVQVSDTDIKLNQLYFFPDKQYASTHIHSQFELHYITEGSTIFFLNFREKVNLQAGDWILVGPSIYHEEHIENFSAGYTLIFDLLQIENDPFFSSVSSVRYYKCKNDPMLGELLAKIFFEVEEKRPKYEISCKNLFSLMFLHICREIAKEENRKTIKDEKQENIFVTIDNFFNQVFKQDGQDLMIEELAKRLHVSPRHMNRILQEHYGVTFHEKLMSTKLKLAEYLLKTTDKSIDEISELCGITSACLFHNFKKTYQITPAKYRKLNRTDTI